MKHILVFILLIIWGFSDAQVDPSTTFVMVGRPTSNVVVNDSTYNSTWEFEVDQLGQSYYPTMIDSGFIALDGNRHLYLVDSVWGANISQAQLRLIGLNSTNGAPNGRGVVYEPLVGDRFLIPPGPVNSDGITPTLQASIIINNLVRSGAGAPFDSDREIGRVPVVGTNIGGSTVNDWLEFWYFTLPTISLSPTTQTYEVGDSNQIIYTWSTSNPSAATLTDGEFGATSPTTTVLKSFGAASSGADTIQFVPTQGGSTQFEEFAYTLRVSQDWDSGSESGSLSASKTLRAVYPVLFGMSSSDSLTTPSAIDPYVSFAKLIGTEGDKSVNLNGSGYIYFLIPKDIPGGWSDTTLSSILDHNGFETLPSFKSYDFDVTSTGLDNNWTVTYRVYQLVTTTVASNYIYQFKQ